MTTVESTTESLSIASHIIPKLSTPLTNTQFITFRNMSATDSQMSIEVPGGSCGSEPYPTCFPLATKAKFYQGDSSNGQGFFYQNGTRYTGSNNQATKSTYGIGCKYFYPPLGVCNPPSNSSALKNYPLGTTFYNPLTTKNGNNIYFLNIIAGVCHKINAPNIQKTPIIVYPPGGPNFGNYGSNTYPVYSNLNAFDGISPATISTALVNNSSCSFTGIGQYFPVGVNMDNVTSFYYLTYNSFTAIDLLYNGTPTFTCPINQLRPAYSKAPNNGTSSTGYQNPFSSSSSIKKKYSYYSYGKLQPSISLFLSESLPNAGDATPSAMFKVVYTLTKADFQTEGIQNQILDMLHFYNTLYSFTNSEYTSPTVTANYSDQRLNTSNENFGTVTLQTDSSGNAPPSPMYSYYMEACSSARRIMVDYCTISGNMSNTLCSTSSNQGLFPHLGLNGSACTDPFSDCSSVWNTYCSNSETFLSTPCKNYFQSGLNNQKFMNEQIQTQLRQVCGETYTAANGENLSSTFYDICGCYLPETVYNDTLQKYNIQGQPVGSVQCWYPSCSQSSTPLMNPTYLECPDTSVSTCIQKSYVNLTDVNGNIKNDNITVNQVLQKCNATQVFDENQNFPVAPDTTVAPTKVTIGAGEYDDVQLPAGQLTSPNMAKQFYPGGFVAVVLVVFFLLTAFIIFGA